MFEADCFGGPRWDGIGRGEVQGGENWGGGWIDGPAGRHPCPKLRARSMGTGSEEIDEETFRIFKIDQMWRVRETV